MEIIEVDDFNKYCSIVIKQKIIECINSKKNAYAVIPTDTVYGMICNYNNEKAKTNINIAKKRSKNKELQILTHDIKTIKSIGGIVSDITNKISKKFHPGPLTIIIQTIKQNKKIGFRIPDNKVIIDILKRNQLIIAATSLNITGDNPIQININKSKLIEYIEKNLSILPSLVIFNKNINSIYKPSSNIIEICNDKILEIRNGIIKFENILKSINEY